jgi:hypothetical protein
MFNWGFEDAGIEDKVIFDGTVVVCISGVDSSLLMLC